jgi:hypothetical protein
MLLISSLGVLKVNNISHNMVYSLGYDICIAYHTSKIVQLIVINLC